MAGWEVSRHPEWDLMYAAGLSVHQISETTGWAVSTIKLHLKRRAEYEPGVFDQRPPSPPPAPTIAWLHRVTELEFFIDDHGRYPARDGEAAERSLALWVAQQRHDYQHGILTEVKAQRLGQVPGWPGKPGSF